MMTLLTKDKIDIVEYSLRDFAFSIAKAAKAGYSLVDTNDGYVNGMINYYHCQMHRDDVLTPKQREAMGLSLQELEEQENVEQEVVQQENVKQVDELKVDGEVDTSQETDTSKEVDTSQEVDEVEKTTTKRTRKTKEN